MSVETAPSHYPPLVKLRRHDMKCAVRPPIWPQGQKYVTYDWCGKTATYGFEGGDQFLCAAHARDALQGARLSGIGADGRFER